MRLDAGTRPSRTARAASSERLCTWSFPRMFLRWNFTVFSLMPSRAAISLLRSPSVTSGEHVQLALGQLVGIPHLAPAATRAGANSARIRAAVAGVIAASPRAAPSSIERS